MKDYMNGNHSIPPRTMAWSEESVDDGHPRQSVDLPSEFKEAIGKKMTVQQEAAGRVVLHIEREDGSSLTLKFLKGID